MSVFESVEPKLSQVCLSKTFVFLLKCILDLTNLCYELHLITALLLGSGSQCLCFCFYQVWVSSLLATKYLRREEQCRFPGDLLGLAHHFALIILMP